ncbi:MAG: T9SS type A sorting domain-containing protein [Bacteroidota bacterium]
MRQTKLRPKGAYTPLLFVLLVFCFPFLSHAQLVTLDFDDLGTGAFEDVTKDLYPYNGFVFVSDSAGTLAQSGMFSVTGPTGAGSVDSIGVYFAPSLTQTGTSIKMRRACGGNFDFNTFGIIPNTGAVLEIEGYLGGLKVATDTFTSAFTKTTVTLDSTFHAIDEIRFTQLGVSANEYVLDNMEMELAPFAVTPVTLSLSGGTLLCAEDSTFLVASVTGGCLNYTYTWSTGDTTFETTSAVDTLKGLPAGTYTLTVTDYSGSVDSGSFTLSAPATLNATATVDANVSCNGLGDGQLTASATGGTAPYDYLWSTSSTNATISSLTPATYTLNVTDNNGCTATAQGTITEPTVLISTALADSNVTCNGFLNGGVKASVTGGTTPYNYTWTNSATTAALTGISAGVYTVVVTDANGCTSTDSASVTEPAPIVATAVIDSNVTCSGFFDGGATASATGGTSPYDYLWSNTATTASITGIAAGTYSVTVTDYNGCTGSDSETIIESSNISVSIVVDSNATCQGFLDGGLTASASDGVAPYTYSWSNTATTASITGVAAGSYTVTATDANGCTANTSELISEPTAVSAQITLDANVSCNGLADGSLSVTGQGGIAPYTFEWSNASTASTIDNLSAANYTVTVTDANGCTSVDSETITEPAELTATVTLDADVQCNGDENGALSVLAAGGTAPYAYSWTNGDSTASVSGLAAGTYTANITDANGCTVSDDEAVSEPNVLVANIVTDATVSCFGLDNGALNAVVTGGTAPYEYTWSTGSNTQAVTDIMAGFYEVNISDDNGCQIVADAEMTQPSELVAKIKVDDNVSCFGLSDGQLSADALGGTPPYSFEWDDEFQTETYTDLNVGIYELKVIDANNCEDTEEQAVTQPDLLVVSTNVIANATCLENNDGQAMAMVTGGTAPYTYEWTGGDGNAVLSGVLIGDYTVSVTDGNGCTEQASVEIVVEDTVPPTVITKDIILELAGSGITELTPEMIDDGSFDACGIEAISVAPNAFTCLNMGKTIEVTVGIIDENGNTASGKAHVTIQDIHTTVLVDTSSATLRADEADASYQWINCETNRSIPGAKEQTFTPTVSGQYAVNITKYGCERVSECVEVTALSTRISSLSQRISLYPNPTSGTYTIALPEVWTEVKVTLTSPTGQLLEEQVYTQVREIASNLTLPAGVYFVKVEAKGENPVTFKLRKE